MHPSTCSPTPSRTGFSSFVNTNQGVDGITGGVTELSLDLPLTAVKFVGLRVGVIFSFQADLLERALWELASVARLPGLKDVERVAHPGDSVAKPKELSH